MEPRSYQERFMKNVVYDVFDGVDDEEEWQKRVRSSGTGRGVSLAFSDDDRESSQGGKSEKSDLTIDNMDAFSRRSIHFESTRGTFRDTIRDTV